MSCIKFVSRFVLDFKSSDDDEDEDCGSCTHTTTAISPILESEIPSTPSPPQKPVCRSIDASSSSSSSSEDELYGTRYVGITTSSDNNDRCTPTHQAKKRKLLKNTDAKKMRRNDDDDSETDAKKMRRNDDNHSDFDISSLKDKVEPTITGTTAACLQHQHQSPPSPIPESRVTAAKRKKRVTNKHKHKRTKRAAIVCTTADEMVRAACLNIHNTDSIDMMEWSEAVLLCLALPTAYDVLDRLSWSDVQTICADNEWSVKIASAIKHHISKSDTLNTLLSRNRREKVQRKYLTAAQTGMFYATPHVNFKLLKTYIPIFQVHARTKFNKALVHTRS